MGKKIFLVLFLMFIPTISFAGIGTGIGISFPFPIGGGSSSSDKPIPSYAAFSDGVLMQELTVEEKNGKYVVTLEVTNLTDKPYTITHKTGQCYEMAILNEKGHTVQRWSSDIKYTQAIQDEVYPPKETVTHRGSFDVKEVKTINGTPSYISAQITDTPNIVVAKLPSKAGKKNTQNGSIRGSIVITNGGRW